MTPFTFAERNTSMNDRFLAAMLEPDAGKATDAMELVALSIALGQIPVQRSDQQRPVLHDNSHICDIAASNWVWTRFMNKEGLPLIREVIEEINERNTLLKFNIPEDVKFTNGNITGTMVNQLHFTNILTPNFGGAVNKENASEASADEQDLNHALACSAIVTMENGETFIYRPTMFSNMVSEDERVSIFIRKSVDALMHFLSTTEDRENLSHYVSVGLASIGTVAGILNSVLSNPVVVGVIPVDMSFTELQEGNVTATEFNSNVFHMAMPACCLPLLEGRVLLVQMSKPQPRAVSQSRWNSAQAGVIQEATEGAQALNAHRFGFAAQTQEVPASNVGEDGVLKPIQPIL